MFRFDRTRFRVSNLSLALAALVLAGCQSAGILPPARQDGVLPPVVSVDTAAQRRAWNAQVYDVAADHVARVYYDHAMTGLDWPAVVAAHRPEAIAATTEAGLYRQLNALFDTLDDRHTAVVSPTVRALNAVRIWGEASVAYGMTLIRQGDDYVVETVRPGSPAEDADVQVGWALISVNTIPAGAPLVAALDRQDAFVFRDETGADRAVTLSGRELEGEPPFLATRRPDGVLVLMFRSFDQASHDWLEDQMAAIRADPPRGVILDLRLNGGGEVSVLGDVVGMFFPNRPPYAVLTGRFIDRRIMPSKQDDVWSGPAAVMIGPASASASELLAAVFQENDRGPVVGRRSAGAVIVSREYDLPDGGELSVSVRAVLTGHRALLEKIGVTPDIAVDASLEDRRTRRDPGLDLAARALLTSKPSPARP